MKVLWHSPTLRTVTIYTASGFGFVGANLVLARVLPTVEYGLFTLVVALVNVGFSLATLGLDGVVNRRSLDAGPVLLRRAVGAALIVGVGLAAISEVAYQLSLPMVLAVLVSTVAGSPMMVAGAKFQSDQRFGISLALTQAPISSSSSPPSLWLSPLTVERCSRCPSWRWVRARGHYWLAGAPA